MRFGLLGPVEVWDDGGRPVAAGGAKQKALLALLLTNANQVVSTDRLIEGLWGDELPLNAATLVQQHVSRLRKLLGRDAIETAAPGYRMVVDEDRIDTRRFEHALAEATRLQAAGRAAEAITAMDAGLALWRGAALADVAMEPGLTAEVDRLEHLRTTALERRAESRLERGDAGVEHDLERLAAANPLRERPHALLMRALYRAGRQADALQVYADLRGRLVSDLGIEPGPELQQLQAGILKHELDAPPPAPAATPPRPSTPSRRTGRRFLAAAAGIFVVAVVVVAVAALTSGNSAHARHAPEVSADARLPFPRVPARLLGSYGSLASEPGTAQVMQLRSNDDPVCTALLSGTGTCFTIRPRDNPADPGARGEAAYGHDGVILRYMQIPFSKSCEGEIDRYTPTATGLDLSARVFVRGPADQCSFQGFSREEHGPG